MIAKVLVGTVCRCPWLSRQPEKEVTLTLDVMEILGGGVLWRPKENSGGPNTWEEKLGLRRQQQKSMTTATAASPSTPGGAVWLQLRTEVVLHTA